MSEITVSMGLNVELLEGAKYDRFTPNISITVNTDSEKSLEQQLEEGVNAAKETWKKLSDTMENLINGELDRAIKWGK